MQDIQDIIVVENVGKMFSRYHADRAVTFKEALLRGIRKTRPVERFWALHEVSFRVCPGEMLGVIGHNGSGKSTLLRLIGGLMPVDKGKVTVNGHIGGLLELGSGFNADLTGRENVFINGVVAGLTRREIESRFEAILSFSELEESIDNPLRTYSTGMKMRLGFSVAVHTDPDVLLIDEVLTVGDMAFQNKCLARIRQLSEQGCAIVFVSHDAEQVAQLCQKALWLRGGEVAAYGEADVVVGQYTVEMSAETHRRTPAHVSSHFTATGQELIINENRFGSLEMEIVDVQLLNASQLPVKEMGTGDPLCVEISYSAPHPIDAPVFGVTISSDDREDYVDVSTDGESADLPQLQGQGRVYLHFERLDLNAGQYYIDVGVYAANWAYAYDYHWHVYPVSITSPRKTKGLIAPPRHWTLEQT